MGARNKSVPLRLTRTWLPSGVLISSNFSMTAPVILVDDGHYTPTLSRCQPWSTLIPRPSARQPRFRIQDEYVAGEHQQRSRDDRRIDLEVLEDRREDKCDDREHHHGVAGPVCTDPTEQGQVGAEC